MANLYALQGRGKTGKTSTLKEVFNQLSQKYPLAVTEVIRQTSDIKIIMVINGIKVGIESEGDPNGRLEESLHDFVQSSCNVIFCAVRTRGMTVDWVEQYAPTYRIQYVRQNFVETDYFVTNVKTAQSLIQGAGF